MCLLKLILKSYVYIHSSEQCNTPFESQTCSSHPLSLSFPITTCTTGVTFIKNAELIMLFCKVIKNDLMFQYLTVIYYLFFMGENILIDWCVLNVQ